jgi:hypothetical protein
MDRLELVKLIEDQAARLTPEGRDLAQRMELLTEAPPGGPFGTQETQRAQADEVWDLPPRERNILERLLMLGEGLERSDAAERQGQPGERYRHLAIIGAAGTKDRSESRTIDPDMTAEQAVARLRGPG